jgi:hypothetical protein
MEQLESLYHPSPLEQAYAWHLLATVFPTSIILDSSSSPSTTASLGRPDGNASALAPPNSIRIAGREAVPFLSQSGLDRTVLRYIWSTVDPNATGKLSSLHQFYVVLRLVALAQGGLLWTPQSSDLDASTISMQIQQYLIQTAQRTDVKLATFAGVTIPDAQVLLPMHAPIHHQHNQDENYSTQFMFSQPTDAMASSTSPAFETPVVSTGAWDALDTLAAANLSNVSPLASPFTNVGMVPIATSAAMEPALGTLDAFSGAPFNMTGPMNVNTAASRVVNDEDNEASDNFGDFEAAPVQVTTGDWDALDGLVTVPDAPLPTLAPLPQSASGVVAGQSASSLALPDPSFVGICEHEWLGDSMW